MKVLPGHVLFINRSQGCKQRAISLARLCDSMMENGDRHVFMPGKGRRQACHASVCILSLHEMKNKARERKRFLSNSNAQELKSLLFLYTSCLMLEYFFWEEKLPRTSRAVLLFSCQFSRLLLRHQKPKYMEV